MHTLSPLRKGEEAASRGPCTHPPSPFFWPGQTSSLMRSSSRESPVKFEGAREPLVQMPWVHFCDEKSTALRLAISLSCQDARCRNMFSW